MNLLKLNFGALLGACLFVTSAAHAITNPSFETGTFSGWTIVNGDSGRAAVVSTYTALPLLSDGRTYTPQVVTAQGAQNGGSYFAKLTAGAGTAVYTSISQTFSMMNGSSLTGVAAFDAVGTSAANDVAELIITSAGDPNQVLWARTISNVGNNKSAPWESWSYDALATDNYTLTFRIKNVGNNLNNSVALLDAVEIIVPDAGSSLMLLGGGLVGIVGLRRRFAKA